MNFQNNLLHELEIKIYQQKIEFEKYMLRPTIALIHPDILRVFINHYVPYHYYEGELETNLLLGLKLIPDYSVKIEDMVEVRGVIR